MKKLMFMAVMLAMLLVVAAPTIAEDNSGDDDGASGAAPETSGKGKGGAGQLASFEGETIDLSQGWQGAKSCVVYARDRVECYATHSEANAALGYSPAKDPEIKAAKKIGAAPIPACVTGWVYLYEHANFGGRRLQFSAGRWQNLTNYGFNDQVSSWRNYQSSGDLASLAEHINGGGVRQHLPGGCVSSSYVGSGFNDKASSVHG